MVRSVIGGTTLGKIAKRLICEEGKKERQKEREKDRAKQVET